jgi:hypothetical protein
MVCKWLYVSLLCGHCPCAAQVLRVFLEADGNLRSNPQWRALKPHVLTPTQVQPAAGTGQTLRFMAAGMA